PILLQRVRPWQRLRLAWIDGPLRVPHARQVRLAFPRTRRRPGRRRMWSDARNREFTAVSQRVQLKVDDPDVQAQGLSRRDNDVLLGVRIESGRRDRQ